MTRQGVLNAMYRCWTIAQAARLNAGGRQTAAHFADMVHQVNKPDFPEDRMNCWLGWMQGILEANGIITGDEANEMNRLARRLVPRVIVHKDD